MERYTVGVVGLGLMGGSFAKAMRGYKDCRILGMDSDENTRRGAVADGTVLEAFSPEDAMHMLPRCDVVMIALYPKAAIDFLRQVAMHCKAGAVVTDMVGIKTGMQNAAKECLPDTVHFVGGHPMAGRAKSGLSAADADLFRDCNYILTDAEQADPHALACVLDIIRYIGAGRITYATADRHDQMIAYTSQMAHVLAAAISLHPYMADSPGFDGGSFADLTRVARLNDAMWSELFIMNRKPLVETLALLEGKLQRLRQAIEQEDVETLRADLRLSSAQKASVEAARMAQE